MDLPLARLQRGAMSENRRTMDETGALATPRTEGMDADREAEHADRGPLAADGGPRARTLLQALADKRRRFVLYYLRNRESAEFEDLTEQLAAWASEAPLGAPDEQTRKSIQSELYHKHLPKLEETGIIRYERDQKTVSFREQPGPIENIIDYCASIESPETTE